MNSLWARCISRIASPFREVTSESVTDVLLSLFVTVERDVELLKNILGGQTDTDQVAHPWRASVAKVQRLVNPAAKVLVASVPFAETQAVGWHRRNCGLHRHKYVLGTQWLEILQLPTAIRQRALKIYNTLEPIPITKRSSPFLGSVPRNAPGGNLGQARSVQVSMRTNERPTHKDSGSIVYEPTAGKEVAG